MIEELDKLEKIIEDVKALQSKNKFHISLSILDEQKFDFSKLPSIVDILYQEKYKKVRSSFYRLKAQCYYQDLKLPTTKRFTEALELLKIEEDNNPNETLRLQAAVYKRKYLHSKNIKDLYQAITYYEETSETDGDKGYGAGNAVYLYYLLIFELNDSLADDIKNSYISKSHQISEKALEKLDKLENKDAWNHASMSALYLSLENFDKAKEHLQIYKDKHTEGFDRGQFVTIEQTIKLFDVLPHNHPEKKLEDILSIYDNAKSMIKSVRIGKIGLALSGGGFRASLFHIGTLLRLAELDILRHVQIISTVSGGSIIGMYYYLELKKLLQENNNSDLNKDSYIELVERVKENFSQAIRESNIRMLAFQKSPTKNLTVKLGELYQEKLYDPIYNNSEVTVPKDMSELKIVPKVDGENVIGFILELHNFELENKVPRIIVNATLLNNGHNWQFSAEGMGENKYMTDMTVENNAPYEFKYFPPVRELDKSKYWKEDIAIANAVASSSAVPVLFDPIELKLEAEIIKLSDGGLYDNLGLASLIADECTHIIVSDGSKQLETNKDPSIFRLDVSSRTTDVLMHRTRDGEYKMAKSLQERGIVEGLSIVHLNNESSTIDNSLQKKLASIRTDLDSFHELEAEGLMYAGYVICSDWFKQESNQKNWKHFELDHSINEKQIENIEHFKIFKTKIEDKEHILDTSSKVFFKTLISLLKNPYIIILIFGLMSLSLKEYPIYTLLVIAVVIILLGGSLKKIMKYIINKFVSVFLMMPISLLDKFIFTKLYIYWGKLNGK